MKKTLTIKQNANEAITNSIMKKKSTEQGVNVSTENRSPDVVDLNGI